MYLILALPVAQTCLCKLTTERGQSPFFKQIFMPYVPVYDKTKKEIILCRLENL